MNDDELRDRIFYPWIVVIEQVNAECAGGEQRSEPTRRLAPIGGCSVAKLWKMQKEQRRFKSL